MVEALRARLACERPETERRVRALASELGLEVQAEADLEHAVAEGGDALLLVLEERGTAEEAVPRVYSVVGANRALLVVVLVPPPREALERAFLAAGAFSVVEDGPALGDQLARALAAARRVADARAESARLGADVAHQDKLAAVGILAAGVSHEVNNPCAALQGNLTALREQLEEILQRPRFHRLDAFEQCVSEWLESLGDCLAAAKRISAIARQLTAYSRRDEGAVAQLVDLNEEARMVLRLVGKEVRFQARFEVKLQGALPPVLAPPNALAQVLTNLIINALQALEHRPVGERAVHLRTSSDAQTVLLEVEDNGEGIAPEVLGRIFDPFFTTKAAGKGTGLGLALTRQLVQRIGGEVFVESRVGQGTRFSVVLPAGEEAQAIPRKRSSMPPTSSRLCVLIVEDDELVLRSLERSLVKQFECITMNDARKALERLRADNHIDVVLSDVVMPGMNGVEFYLRLLQDHPRLAPRMAFFSGGIASEALKARIAATGRPCLAKPIDPSDLIKMIRELSTTTVPPLLA
ncbi:MAG: response regulator [Deltaproteobacteria bacterium]|nr:response regulator [Deltaproteobacteria bacterium]